MRPPAKKVGLFLSFHVLTIALLRPKTGSGQPQKKVEKEKKKVANEAIVHVPEETSLVPVKTGWEAELASLTLDLKPAATIVAYKKITADEKKKKQEKEQENNMKKEEKKRKKGCE